MRQLGGTIKETLDIHFWSTSDDNLEPRSLCGGVCQGPQDIQTILSAATLIKCVDDKHQSLFWDARKFADEFKEESVPHFLWCRVWVFTKEFCNNVSKRGEEYCKFVDESRKDISRLAQFLVVPSTEKCSRKLLLIVETRANRMR